MKIEHAIIKKMSYKVLFHIQNDQDTMTPISFFLKIIIDYFEKGFGLKIVCQDHSTCELFDDALCLTLVRASFHILRKKISAGLIKPRTLNPNNHLNYLMQVGNV